MIETLPLQPLPADAEALRADVRAFLDEALAGMPPELRARSCLGFDAGFSRALGQRGWIGMALAPEYGGGRDYFARFVLVEELLARGDPTSTKAWRACWCGCAMASSSGSTGAKQASPPSSKACHARACGYAFPIEASPRAHEWVTPTLGGKLRAFVSLP